MSEERHLRLREEDLAFFGRIGADASHEMRNVLSVIGECAGLLDDLLTLAETGKPLDSTRLKRLSANITKQVRRGTESMKRFSRFAHATDEQTASVDLTALLENVTALLQRPAALAGCGLQVELPGEVLTVRTNPFSLQRVVFSAIQLMLDCPESGGLVTVKLAGQGLSALVSISGGTPATADLTDRVRKLAAAVSELKGSIRESSSDNRPSLILSFPRE